MRAMKGFSVVELMFVVIIMGLLITLGMPKLSSLLDQSEVSILQKTLTHHISLAKSTAASSGQIVTLCPSTNEMECVGSWTEGSMLFVDRNGNRTVDFDDRVVRSRADDIRHGELKWRAFGNRQYLQFDPLGFLMYQSGNFTYCDSGGDPTLTRQLIVNSVGRVRIAIDSDGDDVREDSTGRAITCT